MRYISKLCVLFFILVYNIEGNSQIDQRLGEWQSFLPYNDGKSVTQSEDKIYYATGISVFSINKNDVDDWMFRSKVDGLSDSGAKTVRYDNFNKQLIIVYENSNIDIVNDNEIINLSNIKDNLNLIGSRAINDIHIFDKQTLFIGTAFGIVELDTEKLEFGSTIITNIVINDITSIGSKLYAATDDGVYYIDKGTTSNIADFSDWKLLAEQDGLPQVYSSNNIETFNGALYINVENQLYYRANDEDIFVHIELIDFTNYNINFIAPANERLIVGIQKQGGSTGLALFFDQNNNFIVGGSSCTRLTRYAVEDQQGRIWYADGFDGIRYTDNDTNGCHEVFANSPSTETASDLNVKKGVLYVATGGVKENFTPQNKGTGFYIFEDGIWNIYSKKTLPILSQKDLSNIYQIEPHPDDDRVFAASYKEGILEYNPVDGTAIHHGEDNSDLQGTVGDSQRERVSGLAFDDNNTLWINNYGSPAPLVALTSEGEWYSFDPVGGNTLIKVIVDQNGYKWSVLAGGSGGVIVFDDNGTLDDKSDDRSRLINNSNSEIATGKINTIAEDLDGEIWVGTSQGPVIFDSGSSIFDSDNIGSRRKVLQDNIPAFLLETQDIRAIEIDGANRKWFGTRNGIFVQSPDGETLILQFNEDNSPLFSNVIDAFEFDKDNGIMYISTLKGLQSYRTQTLGSKSIHDRTVFAFPNPVRPDYSGPIAIKGLARDANVKITDINGKLVFETKALGGQAIWYGKDYNGRKAVAGVYFVFSTAAAAFDTPDSFITKIMIVD
ncbi:MAG: hypothetical protein V3V14_03290 [Saprospiraceae bacterium]